MPVDETPGSLVPWLDAAYVERVVFDGKAACCAGTKTAFAPPAPGPNGHPPHKPTITSKPTPFSRRTRATTTRRAPNGPEPN
jgi:hypothetical protein